MSFEQKVVIVTGAGKGIGRTVAVSYAQQGANVVLVDKDAGELQETLSLIQQSGYPATSHVVDLRKPDEIVAFIEKVGADHGRIDILINNAGITAFISPYDLTVEEWDSVINTNLRATFLCSREAAKIMRKHGGGSIVNLASTRALMSEPNSESYAATKGGILALTHAMAVSFGPDRITVNAISPGWIETGDYESLREVDHLQHPSQRVGRPEDIARACLYLTDPANNFVTGTNLVVDGGMTRKMIYEE
ncbi:SDR family NAD(P)-dependent oxidoreductase [Brevibacillus migulae]|uniref:SDR family NAD(P)-dependent oxidoreductase n=1 Tax=Brevibacillus migulae TaxID=1644114 RepID=UPI00106DED58|nr:glucose 1-dehydrogenase [Brevibacillus migulae]